MIGIDLVDLNDPLLNKREERSLNLILNTQDKLINHTNIFWVLWAAKEAVYKCHRKAIQFSPKSIPIQLKKEGNQIKFRSNSISGKIEVEKNYILALCTTERIDEALFEVFRSSNTMNGLTIRQEISGYFESLGHKYAVGSDQLNLPVLLPFKELISITHHHHMGAFAYSQKVLNA